MERKINLVKDIVVPTATLLIICAVITAALAGTNWLTQKQLGNQRLEKIRESLEKVIMAGEYKAQEISSNGEEFEYYEAIDGELKGYIFITSAAGYGGQVSVITGIQPNGEIVAVEILDASNETAGIGTKIADPAYLEQYKGKSGQLEIVKSDADQNQVNEITGATISSRAVANAVNLALQLFDEVTG